MELYDWQMHHTGRLIKSIKLHGVAKDGSDTGTGKTVMALKVAEHLGLLPFVVCPLSVAPSWKECVHKIFPLLKAPTVWNYEKLKMGTTPFLKKKGRGYEWQIDRDRMLLIFDEDHKCKGSKSKNGKMLIAAKKQGYRLLLLGATSFSSPLEMKALGYALGLHDNTGWWKWCLSNNCKPKPWGGLEYRATTDHLETLHKMVYDNKGSRIRVKDLPKGTFPENLILSDSYALTDDSTKSIAEVYEEMFVEITQLQDKMAEDEYPSEMTNMLRQRQEIELLKVPLFSDLIFDHLEGGSSVVVFLNFKATIAAVGERLLDKSIEMSEINGDQTSEERQASIAKFQENNTKVILCALQAGGVGVNLHDLHGEHPRVSLISPSYSAVDLKQALGRIHRSGSKTPAIQKIVFAKDTIEDEVCAAVRAKLRNIDLINDNDVTPCGI
jgi:SNF2 family DNA or RNA helicase